MYALYFILYFSIINNNLVCRKPNKPTPAAEDVCVFFCPSNEGFEINKALFRNNDTHTLHGFWFKNLLTPLAHLTINEFLDKEPIFKYNFYDLSTYTKTLGCGQYREYVKHVAKSGYNYDQWLEKINSCHIPIYPHQCRFNGSHNIVLSISTSDLGQIGCKKDVDFINFCRFFHTFKFYDTLKI